MYINTLDITNFRTFSKLTKPVSFCHPDADYGDKKLTLPNVNLLLGNNGAGKTSLLKAVALCAMGPLASTSGVRIFSTVRKTQSGKKIDEARLDADFVLHKQDVRKMKQRPPSVPHQLVIRKRGDHEFIEQSELGGVEDDLWASVYESSSDAFFVVGYGATRRVESGESLDMGARTKSKNDRVQRVQGLFEDSYSLIPLTYWLPKMKKSNPGRYKQVTNLFDRITGAGHYQFTGELSKGGDYLFKKGNLMVPFQALSDGYRAFFGWIADMLYHVCHGCPSGAKLVDNQGIVLVDEVDLHLHPSWQMTVISKLAKALPNIQFIFTSHSPLISGSLEKENIIALSMKGDKSHAATPEQSVHGLDADQILISDLFGLKSTRAKSKQSQLRKLEQKALDGDKESAVELIKQLSKATQS